MLVSVDGCSLPSTTRSVLATDAADVGPYLLSREASDEDVMMADTTERVGVIIAERAGSRGRILFVKEFAGNYVIGLHCGSLEGSMEETFVNDSELDKHVFCLVNSKKRHIGASVESLLELKSGSEAVKVLRLNSWVKSPYLDRAKLSILLTRKPQTHRGDGRATYTPWNS